MNQRNLFKLLGILLVFPLNIVSGATPEMLFPADKLQQSVINNYHSKKSRMLKDAYIALQKKDTGKALAFAMKARNGEMLEDYSDWISASALRMQASIALEKKNFSKALSAAKKSLLVNAQIQTNYPTSPFMESLAFDLSQSELLIAQASSGLARWEDARTFFEKAFFRMMGQHQLSFITATQIKKYIETCKKKKGPYCSAWHRKLNGALIKNSEGHQALTLFPESLPQDIKSYRSYLKASVPYKAPDFDQAAFESAMKSYLDEKYGDAIRNFRKFIDDFPKSAHRIRAKYWLSQALIQDKEKNRDQAVKILSDIQSETPFSFYGLLASKLTGKSVDSFISATIPLASERDSSLYAHEIFHLDRAKRFLAEGALEFAALELRDIKARETFSNPFLVYLAMLNFKAKNFRNNFQIISELIQRDFDGILTPYGLRMIFPVDYLDTIKKYSTKNSLDPLLVLSLIKQESAFDKKVKSPAGALGLMQLMPTTAFETDATIGIPNLLEAENNIHVGTLYLKKLLKHFNGNIAYALAGYNAGPKAVERWIKDTGGKGGLYGFIESIPYRETREYVTSIIRNYYWYSRRINGTIQKDFNYFWTTDSRAQNRTTESDLAAN